MKGKGREDTLWIGIGMENKNRLLVCVCFLLLRAWMVWKNGWREGMGKNWWRAANCFLFCCIVLI